MQGAHETVDGRPSGGQLLAALSNLVVRILAEYTGRGPTGARTVFNGDWIFVTVSDALTKGERRLAETGREKFVLETRRAFQGAMREELTQEVEALTGRRVIAFMSDNHFNPDVGLEAMLPEPEASTSG
jgi:uncharacterized protein YbcI